MKCWSIQSKCSHKNIVYQCFCLLLFMLILYVYLNSGYNSHSSSSSRVENRVHVDNHTGPHKCYDDGGDYGGSIDLLDDILASKLQPQLGESILFHETSCHNGIISINSRQACAIESAARTNPNNNVFLLFASPVGFTRNGTKGAILEALLSYNNVHFRNVNLWTYVKGTPINEFLQTNKIFQSKFLTSHLSDLLRYVSLYKWGGTYLDLDVIVKQNLDMFRNYAGAESTDNVAVGMMHFDDGPTGNEIASKCLQEFDKHFDGKVWGNNGPGVITRVLRSMCGTNNSSMMTRERCHGFMVLKPRYVYAVHYSSWQYFFDEKYTNYVLNVTNDSIAVHVWNKLSASKLIRVGSNTAYELLARDYCPRVYGSCGDYF